MNRKDIALVAILLVIAVALRFYDLSYPSFKWMDETGHVPAATNYWVNGQFEPDNWEHPPLRHVILYGFLKIFGDNPFGWRMRNVLFGAVAAVVTFLFAREVTGSRKAALMAGLLLATDPLHIVLSRFTYEEIYGGAFFLTAIVLYIRHNQRSWLLILSAVLMGCALATKWYYVPGLLLICLLALLQKKGRGFKSTVFIVSSYLFIPLSLFILSYWPWFGRGYHAGELIEFLVNAYNAQQIYQSNNFDYGLFFLNHTSATEWFLRPMVMGQGTYLDSGNGEFILYMNNLPLWILTFPAMSAIAVMAFRKRCLKSSLPLLFFGATYMLFVFVKRPVFLYSAIPLLPFAFTAIAYATAHFTTRYSPKFFYPLLAVSVTWNLYLYPLVTAKKVPVAPYRYIIDSKTIKVL